MAHSLKARENTRDTYGVSYLQAFSFYAEYHVVCSGSVFTANVCRGDFRSEKMSIEKYCDNIPRRAYGPLIKRKRNPRDTYGVSYLQAFSFYAEYHVCSGSVFTAYVCRGDFRSEKMAIEKYCDKIPRGAYGPLIKTKRKHQRYIRRFVFAGFQLLRRIPCSM